MLTLLMVHVTYTRLNIGSRVYSLLLLLSMKYLPRAVILCFMFIRINLYYVVRDTDTGT